MTDRLTQLHQHGLAAIESAERVRLRQGEVQTPEIELRLCLKSIDSLQAVMTVLVDAGWSVGKFHLLLDAFYWDADRNQTRRSRTDFDPVADVLLVEDSFKRELRRLELADIGGSHVRSCDMRISVERGMPVRSTRIDSGDLAAVRAWKWSVRSSGRSPSGRIRVDASMIFQHEQRGEADRLLLSANPTAMVVEFELPEHAEDLTELSDILTRVQGL